MYPDALNVGIVLEPTDIPQVQVALDTVKQYEKKERPQQELNSFALPAAAEDGAISISEKQALKIEYFAKIGVDALTTQLRCKNFEYDPLILSSDPLDKDMAADVEAEILQLEEKAVMLQGLAATIQCNLDLSLRPTIITS